MTQVETLVANAASEAGGLNAEGARIMQICNACRYCEGYCAVFPAMERRLEFDPASLAYLSNLCHHCGACFYACQYAPPHEFAVNVPKVFARIRRQSYEDYAWPRAFAAAYRRQSMVLSLSIAGALALFFALAIAFGGSQVFTSKPTASFYSVFPHGVLVTVFGAAFLFAIVAMAVSYTRFAREINRGRIPRSGGENAGSVPDVPAAGTRDLSPVLASLRLDNMRGGGEGCYVRAGFDHSPDRMRRWFHHFTFYGFLLCFASTVLGTIYHYAFAAPAPYALMHPVVIVGTLGGLGLAVGPLGLLWLKKRHDPVLLDESQACLENGFTSLLLATSVTGLALLAMRDTGGMPLLLAIHLGAVLALFITLPYGKFVHGMYRYLALKKSAAE